MVPAKSDIATIGWSGLATGLARGERRKRSWGELMGAGKRALLVAGAGGRAEFARSAPACIEPGAIAYLPLGRP